VYAYITAQRTFGMHLPHLEDDVYQLRSRFGGQDFGVYTDNGSNGLHNQCERVLRSLCEEWHKIGQNALGEVAECLGVNVPTKAAKGR
jgi:hypothetical protein